MVLRLQHDQLLAMREVNQHQLTAQSLVLVVEVNLKVTRHDPVVVLNLSHFKVEAEIRQSVEVDEVTE